MLKDRAPRRWLLLAAAALISAAVMPWAHAHTEAGVVSVSGMPYGAAEILLLAGVAVLLLLSGRAQAATYLSLTAVGFSALVLYNLPGSLAYGAWQAELTGGPVLALFGTSMLFLAAVSRRRSLLQPG